MSDPSAANLGEQPGDVIGRYKLLERIGEGGMGSVWMAEQKEPVKRRVAVKVIKLGMDTKQVIARFEAERQALALMDHPHIAKVLDAGATQTGRPYFVMEYIKGVPIVEYCDQERLDTRARLELFTGVCQAIQHAHHKGIIHRDIKPGNVLVTLHDGVPVPKVIDFGIAKATSFELTTKTLFTEHRQMLGTPAYMSPEQAEMSGLDIDTRTDVYSLGVLLYELLTGTTPFDIKSLLESGFGEMMRAIREDEPHKPSTRISTLGETALRTAQQRRVDVRKLSLLLRGDLDWIVMKCLEKDRTRRYETASGLAADVRRHLFDEPVTASPPGTGYRLRKFMRRHRAQAVAACVVLALLVLGAAGTSAGMIWASEEAERAEKAKTKATLAAAAEAKAKTQAQENERAAIAAARAANAAKEEEARSRRRAETISGFVVKALRSSDPEHTGGAQATTVLAAMQNAIADIDSGRFADDPTVEAGLRGVIGRILHSNGRLREAEALLARALETERRLAGGDSEALSVALNNLGLVVNQLGRRDEARRLLEEALEMSRRLHPGDHPGGAICMTNLAVVSAPEKAEPLVREALAMNRRLFPGDSGAVATALTALAGTLQALARTTEAEPLFAEALEMSRRVYKGDHPALAVALDNLGKVRVTLGRPAEGTKLLEDALGMRRRMFKGPHPDVAKGLHNLASVLKEQQRWSEAEPLSAELLAMQRTLTPGDDVRVAELLFKLGLVRRELGRWADAEPAFTEALKMRQRLHHGDHPDVAACFAELGTSILEQRRSEEARPLLVQAVEMYGRLELPDAANTAKALDNLGKALQRVDRPGDAEALLARALSMRERLYDGDDPDLATGLNNLATAQLARRRFAEAEATQRRALAMRGRLHPGDHADNAFALQNLAIILRDAGRPADAEPIQQQALDMYRRVFPGDHAGVALALHSLGTIRDAAGRAPEAVPLHEEALQMNRRLLPAGHPDLLATVVTLARSYYFVGRFEKAIPLFEEGLLGYEAALGRRHPQTLLTIGNLGANYKMDGRIDDAIPLLEEAWREAKRLPQLSFVDRHLLDAYVRVADRAKAGTTERAMALLDELLDATRSHLPKESPALARELTAFSGWLLGLKAWDQAEALLREALAIRERTQPEVWTTFNTRSLLGEALLGQARYADAEPLLLDGYRGMKAREATIDPGARVRLPQALERLVRLYEAKGDADAAAQWRRELDLARGAGAPATPGK